jgi:hypothetical protein
MHDPGLIISPEADPPSLLDGHQGGQKQNACYTLSAF